MDHVRGAHDVPWDVKSASLEKSVPPWTVQRQVWSDSLMANHSGILTDVLLFSDIHLSLTHHYRVHKRRLPHIAFRKDYLTRLRVSMSQAAGQSRRDMMSPVPSRPVSTRHARSAERDSESARKIRHARCQMRPVRVLEESVGELLTLFMTVGLSCCLCLCDSRILVSCLCGEQLFQPAWLRLPRRTSWQSVV